MSQVLEDARPWTSFTAASPHVLQTIGICLRSPEPSPPPRPVITRGKAVCVQQNGQQEMRAPPDLILRTSRAEFLHCKHKPPSSAMVQPPAPLQPTPWWLGKLFGCATSCPGAREPKEKLLAQPSHLSVALELSSLYPQALHKQITSPSFLC